ncbi:hypothetical protein GUI12_02535 [Anaplasmataceae bacterium AB001_6]|nr:hypothetical protein GUI12_02535 [Anaplasmataceae bacterium AB001_6]
MRKIFNKLLSIFPAYFFLSAFGVGYLPTWQSHWAAFAAILISHIIVFFTVGYQAHVIEFTFNLYLICAAFLIIFSFSFLILFLKGDEIAHENVMIASFFGQMIFLFATAPMVFVLRDWIQELYDETCENLIECAIWVNQSMVFLTLYGIFYFIYRVIDVFKLWPVSFLERDYHNALSYIMQGIINAFYSSLIVYFVGFVFFNLNFEAVYMLYKTIFQNQKMVLLSVYNESIQGFDLPININK